MLYSVFSKPVPLVQPDVIAYECEVFECSGGTDIYETPWECAKASVQVNSEGECDPSFKVFKCSNIQAMNDAVIEHCKERAAFVFKKHQKKDEPH